MLIGDKSQLGELPFEFFTFVVEGWVDASVGEVVEGGDEVGHAVVDELMANVHGVIPFRWGRALLPARLR